MNKRRTGNSRESSCRRLLLVLGDQLSDRLPSFSEFDPEQDRVWMAEVVGESQYVWSSKVRSTLFLSAMRHFAADLEEKGIGVSYRRLGDEPEVATLGEALAHHLQQVECESVWLTRPGEYRILSELESVCEEQGVELRLFEDDTFYSSLAGFKKHAEGRKQLRMEYFYREMRREHGVLMDGKEPEGGNWNFDSSNRKSFGKNGPERLFPRPRFDADGITREVIEDVEQYLGDHPGSLDSFGWPVTRKEALEALDQFVDNELPQFGAHQDAMWTGEPYLNHSLISSSLNLKLLDPREAVEAAEMAYRKGNAPIESVEGFIRQILGWREYVRGVYWLYMPDYLERNELGANSSLPEFYWSGDTDLKCIKEVVTQTMEHGYAHHIQRLMITGLYALLLGVDPKKVHEWYLAVYVDAVEWVELPNTLGMSQYADGGVMGSKPYVASGKYINRMSNYCRQCRYDPDKRTGDDACPFTVLYWDYLDRNKDKLSGNPRMRMQLRNLDRIESEEMKIITETARKIRSRHTGENQSKES